MADHNFLSHFCLSSLLRITPRLGRLGCALVDGPLRQGEPRCDVGKDHTNTRADADAAHHLWRRQRAVRRREVADDAQRLVPAGIAVLRIEVDQQDEIGRVRLEGRLNGVMDLGVGVGGAARIDRVVLPFQE